MKKKTLFTSILTIALCLSLIAGSTFALFTSESKTNIAVTSGKVDVTAAMTLGELYSPKGVSLDGVITDETNIAIETAFANGGTAVLNGNELTLTNVTPGDKVNFTITITNNSNVDIKYRTVIAHTGDNTLFNALDFQIGTDTDDVENDWQTLAANVTDVATLDCSVELPATAGNTLQGLTCTIIFTVEAVQGNTDPDVTAVSDLESLRAAIANGDNVKLMEDIVLESEDCYEINSTYGYCLLLAKKSTDIDLNGHTITYTRDTDAGDVATRFGIVAASGATVNVYDSSADQTGGIIIDNDDDNDDSWGMVLYAENGATLNVYGGNYVSSHSEIVYSQGKAPNYAAATINLYGGKYSTTYSSSSSILNIKNDCASRIHIYGGSYKSFEPGVTNSSEAILADGYTVIQDGDWYTVVAE